MSDKPSRVVQAYARWVPRQMKLAAKQPEAWVAGTRKFGLQMMVVGIALLLGTFFLPDDDRRWIFVGMAVLTIAVGGWHRAAAPAIAKLATGKSGNGAD